MRPLPLLLLGSSLLSELAAFLPSSSMSWGFDVESNQKEQLTEISKLEIRNSKQFQMTEMCKIPNRLRTDSMFWIFPSGDLFVSGFVSDFDIRIWGFALRLERLEQLERF